MQRLQTLSVALITVASLLAGTAQVSGDPVSGDVESLLRAGRLPEAESALRAQIAEHPNARLFDLLGITLSRQQRAGEAEAAFQRALELVPEDDSPQSRSARSVIHQHLARHLLLVDRPDAAADALRQAARLGEIDRELAFSLASLEAQAGQLDAAAGLWRSLAEGGSVRAGLHLAELEMRRGQTLDALRLLQQALETAPNSEDVLSAYARTSLAAQLPVPAILALRNLTRMHPDEVDYAYLLGVARMQVAELTGALETLLRATELQPGHALAWLAIALTYNQQKRYDEAIPAAEECLRLDPTNLEALAAKAEALEGLGRLDPAEDLAQRVLAQDAQHATANLVAGMIGMKRQQYAEARDAFRRSLAKIPSPKGHYQLSLALARLGDSAGSERHVELYRDALQEFKDQQDELRAKRLPIEDPSS